MSPRFTAARSRIRSLEQAHDSGVNRFAHARYVLGLQHLSRAKAVTYTSESRTEQCGHSADHRSILADDANLVQIEYLAGTGSVHALLPGYRRPKQFFVRTSNAQLTSAPTRVPTMNSGLVCAVRSANAIRTLTRSGSLERRCH